MSVSRQDPLRSERPATKIHGLVLLTAALGASSCVDIGQDPTPAAMRFDPTINAVPQPTALLVNPQTGLLDLSLAGIEVPEDCQNQTNMSVAQCEFYQYLESLDGFPTLTTATAPASEPLDMATVTVPDNLFVLDGKTLKMPTADELDVTFDATSNLLELMPKKGWDVGRTYVIAVRGYDNGVKTADGREVVADVIFYLLRQDDSLTCGAATADAIPADCEYLELLVQQLGDEATAREQLLVLEQTRQQIVAAGLFDAINLFGGMPKDEVAVAWAFPIHSGPVAELQPALGIVPEVRSATEIFLPIKGTLDASSLSGYTFMKTDATVYLLDLTPLAAGNIGDGIVAFNPVYQEEPNGISFQTDAPLKAGDLYCIILSKGITDTDGHHMVESPVTVFLKSHGELVDSEGHSTVEELDDASAAQLEEGRAMLAQLLDDERFGTLTGLDREKIAYIYAFEYQAP